MTKWILLIVLVSVFSTCVLSRDIGKLESEEKPVENDIPEDIDTSVEFVNPSNVPSAPQSPTNCYVRLTQSVYFGVFTYLQCTCCAENGHCYIIPSAYCQQYSAG